MVAPNRRSRKSRRDVFELEAIRVCSSMSDLLMPQTISHQQSFSSRWFPCANNKKRAVACGDLFYVYIQFFENANTGFFETAPILAWRFSLNALPNVATMSAISCEA